MDTEKINGVNGVHGFNRVHHAAKAPFKVIIIGAGACGLLVGQGLKKDHNLGEKDTDAVQNGIAYSIHDKELATSRPRDWGMSYFWSADYLPKLLPESLIQRLTEIQVDPTVGPERAAHMFVTHGTTGEILRQIPTPGGRRVGRRKLRKLWSEGIDINFNQKLTSISYPSNDTVTAHFHDGTSVTGNILLGTDGGGSTVRRYLLGDKAEPKTVNCEMANFNVRYQNPEHALFIHKRLQPNVDQGVHPKGQMLTMCLQDVPDPNDPTTWLFQVTSTWAPWVDPYHPSETRTAGTAPPHSLAKMADIAADWCSPRKEAMAWARDQDVETPIFADRMATWIPVPWDSHAGRVTLGGDAAHAVTFHRAQGLNNCIRDAKQFLDAVLKVARDGGDQTEAIEAYGAEVVDRGAAEVQLSEEQLNCAHEFEAKFDKSPVMQVGFTPVRPR
ncbi:MAG: hypothetical protein Q9160_000447 [Pyrenula sp. 1 TL-2023]